MRSHAFSGGAWRRCPALLVCQAALPISTPDALPQLLGCLTMVPKTAQTVASIVMLTMVCSRLHCTI